MAKFLTVAMLTWLGPLAGSLIGLAVLAFPACSWDEFVVLTSDFTTLGAVTAVQRYEPWTATPDQEWVHSDAVARYYDGLYYVVGRGSANHIQIIDPGDGYRTLRQFSLGGGLNLQDIAFTTQGAYVTCYDTPALLKVDVASGMTLASFSTAPFADADGLPETSWLCAVDDRLYITCQLLDRSNWYLPTGPGCLLVFDTLTDSWVDLEPGTPATEGIVLVGANPYTRLEPSPDRSRLRVGCSGIYGLLDGGVEVVDLTMGSSLGFEISEVFLGGDILDFVTIGPTLAYASISDADFHTSLVSYVPLDGQDVQVIAAATTYAYVDLAFDGVALLYVADRTAGHSGLLVFDSVTGAQLTAVPVPVGLPPAQIALPVDESSVPVSPEPVWRIQISALVPNPANPGTHVRIRGPAEVLLPLRIYDLRGRQVREAIVGTDSEGDGVYFFDGRDDAGGPVASGSYLVMVGQGETASTRGLTIVR